MHKTVRNKIKFVLLTLSCIVFLQSCSTSNELIEKRTKAIHYINAAPFQFDYVYLYSYIGRSHQLPKIQQLNQIANYRDSLKNLNTSESNRTVQLMHLFGRLTDPNHSISSNDLIQTTGLDSLMLIALHSNNFKVDTNSYFKNLRKNAGEGQYNTTHSLLSIIFLEDNRFPKSPAFMKLKKHIQQQNMKMLEGDSIIWDDIKIESVALLLHSGVKLKSNLLEEIFKLQNEDGGWGLTENSASNNHATILAIWILSSLIK